MDKKCRILAESLLSDLSNIEKYFRKSTFSIQFSLFSLSYTKSYSEEIFI